MLKGEGNSIYARNQINSTFIINFSGKNIPSAFPFGVLHQYQGKCDIYNSAWRASLDFVTGQTCKVLFRNSKVLWCETNV